MFKKIKVLETKDEKVKKLLKNMDGFPIVIVLFRQKIVFNFNLIPVKMLLQSLVAKAKAWNERTALTCVCVWRKMRETNL